MAKTAVQLEEEENRYFHMNYSYMWKKLNTAPYYVSGSGEIPKWIREQWLLPSYANLSRCLNPSFVPSMNIVNKIVQFYNANLQPEVDAYVFLHEKLESTDNLRSASVAADTEPYCGLYYCYYYAGMLDRREVYGAVMHIQKSHDTTSVQMITGITDDSDLYGLPLKNLIGGKDIPIEQYREYRDHLELSKRRTALYKGTAELAPGILTVQMQSEDREGSLLVLRFAPTEGVDGRYLGSIGLLTMFSDRELQILKMGVLRADNKDLTPFSLADEQLHRILSIEKLENEHVLLAFRDNSRWNDMILSNAR